MYVFNHIPKCGGNSINEALKTWGDLVLDYATSPPITEFKANQILCGHGLAYRYPTLFNKENIHIFTFIRDPLALMISNYYYFRNRGGFQNITLDEYIFAFAFNTPNIIAHNLRCNETNYIQIMNLYSFIGISEYLQESFDILCLLTNHKLLKLQILNVSKKDDQTVSKELIDFYKKRNELDYKIYSYCKNKLEKTIDSNIY